MANPIKIAIDRQAQALATITGFISQFPTLYQGDVRDLIIQVVDPGSVTGSPAPVDLTGYTMRVSLGSAPTGATPSTIYAQNLNLAWNANAANAGGITGGYFSGTLDLTQAALTTALGSLTKINAFIDIDIRLSGVTQTLYQNEGVSVSAVVDSGANTSSPANPQTFYNVNEANNLFVKRTGLAGEGFIMVSADGTQTRLIILGNDGQLLPQLLT